MKIKQYELAKVLNTTPSTISKYKTHKLELRWSQVKKLKKAFQWSDNDIDNFFTGNTTKLGKCAQELPTVTRCDDGNKGEKA
jgi:predicted transcriptional regulator